MKQRFTLVAGVVVAFTLAACTPPEPPQSEAVQRVSVASDGTEGNDSSEVPSISADGRYITYMSYASNLVTGDTNNAADIFVWDRQTGTTQRISLASDGTEGNDGSDVPSISADGRYITYTSDASNLVTGDTNNAADIFVWDRQTGTTQRVSVASDGTEGNATSGAPSISADGRYITYWSLASNLVPGGPNGCSDVFVWDRHTGTTQRVSIASDGTQANGCSGSSSISGDGRYITYDSDASNLVPGDTNNARDVFVWGRDTGTTQRISLAPDSTEGNDVSYGPSISADGRYITYTSDATNLVPGDTNNAWDVFVWDRQTGTTQRISLAPDGTEGNASSGSSSISADGRYITYTSDASNLVPGDTNNTWDVFVWDRQTGTTQRISLAPDGTEGNASSGAPSISADGRYITYLSNATNLVTGDTNNTLDVFVWDRNG